LPARLAGHQARQDTLTGVYRTIPNAAFPLVSTWLKLFWQRLPLGVQHRQQLKDWLFSRSPWLWRHTEAYRQWRPRLPGALAVPEPSPTEPVPRLVGEPPATTPVRLLAFYLPQFHPIPENDQWWGPGFTEWSNVVRAKPQFAGHYQPRLPADLGFYDLRLIEVQQQQVELARLYGLGGFAFYFYWFTGRRLLERPLLQYLVEPSLDLPFCLCWANESWTRRWDGRADEELISQKHTPEDDLAFIAYVARYLRDPRYIRINGRPLLIVYRPDLLPSAKATGERWRRWCRDNGVGEIYLAYTQSFETKDPAVYGLDAAIEFPPNQYSAPVINGDLRLLNPAFKGIVHDWRAFPEHSRHYPAPAYRLFRGVNPGWDNEARRSGGGRVFHGATAEGYSEWLANAISDTVARFDDPEERIVFVNAWNEWAEGAYLEPDQRYGHAFLQATRDALLKRRTTHS
jgi:lipopolysaccharide biosynthesis protein